MRADGFEDLQDKMVTVQNHIKEELSKIPIRRLFDFYECYYDRVSRLCRYINHLGFGCYLISGRLLNIVRDNSVSLDSSNCAYTMSFSILDEVPDFGNLWEVVRDFVGLDSVVGWDIGTGLDSEYSPMWLSSNYTDENNNYVNVPEHIPETANIMQFNLSCVDFAEFPLQQLEFIRYKHREDIAMYVNGYIPHFGDEFINSQWFVNGSRVELYGSTFLTLNSSYFEMYFRRKYGDGWKIPLSEDVYNKQRFEKGVWHK